MPSKFTCVPVTVVTCAFASRNKGGSSPAARSASSGWRRSVAEHCHHRCLISLRLSRWGLLWPRCSWQPPRWLDSRWREWSVDVGRSPRSSGCAAQSPQASRTPTQRTLDLGQSRRRRNSPRRQPHGLSLALRTIASRSDSDAVASCLANELLMPDARRSGMRNHPRRIDGSVPDLACFHRIVLSRWTGISAGSPMLRATSNSPNPSMSDNGRRPSDRLRRSAMRARSASLKSRLSPLAFSAPQRQETYRGGRWHDPPCASASRNVLAAASCTSRTSDRSSEREKEESSMSSVG